MKLLILLIFIFNIGFLESQIIWEQVREPEEFHQAVSCADENNCVTLSHISRYRRLVKTNNGGKDWTAFYEDQNQPDKPIPLTSEYISYPEKNKLFIPTADAKLLIYNLDTDLQDTIVFESVRGRIYTTMIDIHMINDKVGIIGAASYVFITNDGWQTYKEIVLSEDLIPEGYNTLFGVLTSNFVHAFDEDNFLINITFFNRINNYFKLINIIARSSDKGDSWYFFQLSNKEQESEKALYVRDFYFHDNDNGWAVIHKDSDVQDQFESMIYKTSNSGLSWDLSYHTTDTNLRLRNVTFKDYRNGLAVGIKGTILTTYDGGVTWNNETPTDTNIQKQRSYQYVTFAGENPILVTSRGGILKGKFPTSVKSEKYDNRVSVFPNPASDFITISFKPSEGLEPSEGYRVQIFDMLGLEVAQTPSSVNNMKNTQTGASDLLRIDVSHLPAGVYFIRIGNIVEKFVKM